MRFDQSTMRISMLVACSGWMSLEADGKKHKPSGRFLHITDMHLDLQYKPYSMQSTRCREYPDPIQSQESIMKKKKKEDRMAGVFGLPASKTCDSPYTLIDHTFNFVGDQDLDFIIWTGDSGPHKYKKMVKQVEISNEFVAEKFKKNFKKIPILPSLGNNDLYIHNKVKRNDKTMKRMAKVWKDFIPKDQLKQFKRLGCFSKPLVKGKVHGISVNTMFWTTANKLVESCEYDDSPGHEQMIWLEQELNEAKKNGLKVILAGHVAPTEDQYKLSCLKQYTATVFKYKDMIEGMFFGHNNFDAFFFLSPEFTAKGTNSIDEGTSTVTEIEGDRYLEEMDDDEDVGTESRKDKIAGKDFVLDVWHSYKSLITHVWKDIAEVTDNVMIVHVAPSVVPVFDPGVRIWSYDTDNGKLKDYEQWKVDLAELNAWADGRKDAHAIKEPPHAEVYRFSVNRDDSLQLSLQEELNLEPSMKQLDQTELNPTAFQVEYHARSFLGATSTEVSADRGPLTIKDYVETVCRLFLDDDQVIYEQFIKYMIVSSDKVPKLKKLMKRDGVKTKLCDLLSQKS